MNATIAISAFIAIVSIMAIGAHFEISRRIRGNPDHWYHD